MIPLLIQCRIMSNINSGNTRIIRIKQNSYCSWVLNSSAIGAEFVTSVTYLFITFQRFSLHCVIFSCNLELFISHDFIYTFQYNTLLYTPKTIIYKYTYVR